MDPLYEYCNVGDNGNYATRDDWRTAQTFTPVEAHKITSVKLKMYRINNPGDIIVSIKATDGAGKPVGEDLCSGSLNANDFTNSSPGLWYEIQFDPGANLEAGVLYAIVAYCPDADGANYVNWRRITPNSYDVGWRVTSTDYGETWTINTSYDMMFEDWGEEIAPPAVGRSYGYIIA